MSSSKYIIGIDLGTTNSAAAYTDAHFTPGTQPNIHLFEIPQLVDADSVANRPLLPSCVLLAENGGDGSRGGFNLPWDSKSPQAVGEYARDRGAEIPQRLISSAKSWLCHPQVDRNEAILPWEGTDPAVKMSPVAASAAVLRHLRSAWNETIANDDETLRFEHQEIYLTVPASFDAVARELTVKAANMAGLKHITLLEEPQAAFYAWIESAGDRWRDAVRKGDLILVCDVGGGTSDFSLIRISEEDGRLVLDRIAVGDHLLVGGDNMDLALAYHLSRKLAAQGTRLDAWQFRGLWHACRTAKEKLLADPERSSYPVTILGRGSSLIGGMQKTELARGELSEILLDGFFPPCDRDDRPTARPQSGIREIGLPYEQDPAVTRHLAQFLSGQGQGDDSGGALPTGVMFNGGVMKAPALRGRVLEVLSRWTGQPIREIPAVNFDLAVARGAAYYGLARRGGGVRIRGGLGKSYYIGIEAAMPAVPGMPPVTKALCVAPFGMEEGGEDALPEREFMLVVGDPVRFDFLGSTVRQNDGLGAVVEDWSGDIHPITTLETTLDGDPGSHIPVTLEIKVTEIGTLEIWCVSEADERRWKLEFNVREKA